MKTAVVFGVWCFGFQAAAQTTLIQVGDSTTTNTTSTYPCPYGNDFDDSRHQMLIRADELSAVGMVTGDITSIFFKVDAANFEELDNFEIRIGHTNDTVLGTNFIGGLISVFGPVDFTNQNGWNQHTLFTPFTWDGVSNIVIQTCNNNINNSDNPVMVHTTTSFTSSIWNLTNTGNICNGGTPQAQSNDRPILRFLYDPAFTPPLSSFSPQNITSCSGTVQFNDLSGNDPDTWFWDFGDGNTDTVQDPIHSYTSDGSYDVTLITTNAFGTDTLFVPNAITVSVSSPQPVGACVPTTTSSLAGFGILNISFANTSVSSPDGQTENYADRACQLDTVFAGTNMTIDISTGTVAPHNVRTWIDWDNSGTFSSGEMVLTENSVIAASASFIVPSAAVQNTPLRLRAAADFQVSPFPTPCGNPQYGQVEDYGLVILANTQAPLSDFESDVSVTCDGSVQFTDVSQNAPTIWQWDFGDGGSSNDPDPLHVYSTSGVYTVTLITFNAFGSDTLVMPNLITVDLNGQLQPAACTPATQAILGDYGIYNVTLGTINNTTDGAVDGYQDYSCEFGTSETEGVSIPFSITTGIQNGHDISIWLDLDNDGNLTASELIWSDTDVISPTGNLTVPIGAVYNTPLRLRIAVDALGGLTSSCDQPSFGQVEDYAMTVLQNTAPPIAFFSADMTTVCAGDSVRFIDQTQNIALTWAWDFGDGGSSTDQNPYHTYMASGSYNVTLTVTNANGSDGITQTNFIQVVEPLLCDTLNLATGDQFNNQCAGVLTDDGGPNGSYSFFGQGLYSIVPTSGDVVILNFSQFDLRNQDDLIIYDGPDDFSPVLGTYSGTTLPNGGTVISSGPAVSLEIDVNGGPGPGGFPDGFLLNWQCSFNSIHEIGKDELGIFPNPANDVLNIWLKDGMETIESFVIYNSTGMAVERGGISIQNDVIRVEIGALSSGNHTIQLIGSDRLMTGQFVVVR